MKFNDNIKSWSDEKYIAKYRKSSGWLDSLLAPEKHILNFIGNLSIDSMLDIGVGGGRTTQYFHKITNDYLAIDYSEKMIKICNQKFKNLKNAKFEVSDARNMKSIKDSSIDFVLFSFNGIDNVDLNDRSLILDEMRRVCRPGGHICFSSHNLLSVHNFYKISYNSSVRKSLLNIIRALKFSIYNLGAKNKLASDYLYINDPGNEWSLKQFYVNPFYQKKILSTLGFKNIKLFNSENGEETLDKDIFSQPQNAWIYFLAEK